VIHACILAIWEAEIKRITFEASLGKKGETLSQKYATQKMAGRVA
jgi:hypothetical protein